MTDDVRSLIGALGQGDMAQANSIFQDTINARVSTAMDARKIAVASEVMGSEFEIESDEAMEFDDSDLENELDSAEEDDYIPAEDGEPVEYDSELDTEEED